MANEQNLKPFTKGDKRINRNGRPTGFKGLRKLATAIAREGLGESNLTTIEAILRKWASGKDGFAAQARFVEIAYGKVPDQIELKGDMAIRPVVYLPSIEEDDPNPNRNILLDQSLNPDSDEE